MPILGPEQKAARPAEQEKRRAQELKEIYEIAERNNTIDKVVDELVRQARELYYRTGKRALDATTYCNLTLFGHTAEEIHQWRGNEAREAEQPIVEAIIACLRDRYSDDSPFRVMVCFRGHSPWDQVRVPYIEVFLQNVRPSW